ncbi:AAA-like domain-containing protein [Leptolyngbya sp. FACHB-671]|uniref:AAA-like domain-containing protein n=1 Tax=Leptolyngbya sp. FACHB-671 TaxID=2692812 RepID=UPI002410DF10|nr:AAA-like domain-containing protein [Leptolyngbya sp. FACHB-671]
MLRAYIEKAGTEMATDSVEQLMSLMGSNPYLIQLALHHLSGEEITLDERAKSEGFTEMRSVRPLF